MIKAVLNNGTLVLGITRENVDYLLQGRPILAKKEDVGVERDVLITYGETLQDILSDLQNAGLDLMATQG